MHSSSHLDQKQGKRLIHKRAEALSPCGCRNGFPCKIWFDAHLQNSKIARDQMTSYLLNPSFSLEKRILTKLFPIR